MQSITVRVFVSCTWLDLQPEREAVEAALQRLRETKFVGMEYFGSRDQDTCHASLDELGRSQLYVGIFGGRYGSGITEAEYRRARERGLPCFIYFKDEASIPAEGKESDPEKAAKLAALKKELRAAHTIASFTLPDDLAAKLTADLHRWLFEEYLAPRLEEAARGEFPREDAQALLATIKDVGALNQALVARLEELGHVVLRGERSISDLRDVTGSILITGDHNVIYQAIAQQYPRLKDYAYDLSDLIVTTTRWFVGRTFVFGMLQEFQGQHPCGYVRIVADAGLGKTALAAEIARRYRAPAFFANASSGLTRPDQCLNHLSAELIARFGLEYDHLPPRAGEDSAFLSRILAEAAGKAAGPLWVVVDALDEAESPIPGRNSLLLPDHLPHGVYLVVTHCPGEYPIVTDPHTPTADHTIAWNDPNQQGDIEAHLRNQAKRPEIRCALEEAAPPIPAERFVAMLEGASQGNFKYLDYVLADIAARESGFDPLNLDALPHGLKAYYAQFWSRMEAVQRAEGWSEWNSLYRPVIALLGAAAEPVTEVWLAAHTGRGPTEIRERALQRWQRFLSRERRRGQGTWRIIHQSFADFLAEKVDLPAAHCSVAAYYRSNPSRWPEHGGYAHRHLSAHLRKAGEQEALFALVDDRAWYDVQVAEDPSGAAYLNDVTQAWAVAEERNLAEARRGRLVPLLGREVHCALATASIRTVSGQIPPTLLVALVATGLWGPADALSAAEQNPSPALRAKALAALAPHLAGNPAFLGNALAAAARMAPDIYRARVLAALAPHLAGHPALLAKAVAAADAIGWDYRRADVVAALAPHLPPEDRSRALTEALARARAIRWDPARADALAALAPHLPPEDRSRVLTEALALARALDQAIFRTPVLAALAPHLAGHPSLLNDALVLAQAIGSEYWRAQALAALAPHLPPEDRSRVLTEALALVPAIRGSEARAQALAALAPHLPAEDEHRVVSEALGAVRNIDRHPNRARALASLAPHLAGHPSLLNDAVVLAQAIRSEYYRTHALAALAPHLPPEDRSRVLTEALGTARATIGDCWPRTHALAALAPHLPPDDRSRVLTEALALVPAIRGSEYRARALASLAPHLAGHPALLAEALAAAQAIEWEHGRAAVVAALAPHLPPDDRLRVLTEVMADSYAHVDPETSADILAALAPHLVGYPTLITKALAMARAIDDDLYRMCILGALAEHLAAMPPVTLYALWRETLHVLALRTRQDVLRDLGELSNIIVGMGGSKAALETAEAITLVGCWWP